VLVLPEGGKETIAAGDLVALLEAPHPSPPPPRRGKR
jgi:hypothetical protein